MPQPLDRLVTRLKEARRVTVLTGAGVSAASGVPTFRGAGGLYTPSSVEGWRQYRPEELATPQAFARDPRLVWEWYAWRREKIAACRPNRAHEVLAAWTRRSPEHQLVTQNVDDLHVRAGSDRLIRLHGSIWELACCKACVRGEAWRDDRVPLPLMPHCPHCGGLARPAVVWFGEPLAARDLEAARQATSCDVFLTVGTSAIVYPVAGLVEEARERGAFTAEINLEATPASRDVDVAIHAPAEEVLDEIETALVRSP